MTPGMRAALAELDAAIVRAERNVKLFNNVAWVAHLEIVQPSDLPGLYEKRASIEENMEVFADEADEIERLTDCLEVVNRTIRHLERRK